MHDGVIFLKDSCNNSVHNLSEYEHLRLSLLFVMLWTVADCFFLEKQTCVISAYVCGDYVCAFLCFCFTAFHSYSLIHSLETTFCWFFLYNAEHYTSTLRHRVLHFHFQKYMAWKSEAKINAFVKYEVVNEQKMSCGDFSVLLFFAYFAY